MTRNIGHRRDIDGLRAFAILSVILYHYGVPGFSGGFAGVDVFFVISGYLIGGQVAAELDAGTFSLLRFYERRVRRILPALFFVYALVTLAAAAILFPPDLVDFTRLAFYVIPFAANIEFYLRIGAYGGPFAQNIVMLHSWSLAVEEQFYLLFPWLMLGCAHFMRRHYGLLLGGLALFSFLICLVGSRVAPIAAFYLGPFRAWELLAGALLAIAAPRAPRGAGVRGALLTAGLALLAASDLLLSNIVRFPSEYTLLPCAGALLVLHARAEGPIARLLDNPAMTRLGLWSYSLYLIHWPLLVLARYYFFEPLSPAIEAGLLTATLAFGAFSWRYIEQPFRGAQGVLRRPRLFAAAGGGALLLAALTAWLHWGYDDPSHYGPVAQKRFPVVTLAQHVCANSIARCVLGDRSVPPETLLWGDSHAISLVPAVDDVFAGHRSAIAYAQRGGCPPLLDVEIVERHSPIETTLFGVRLGNRTDVSDVCQRHNHQVLEWVRDHGIRTVLLVAHWTIYDDHFWLRDAEAPANSALAGNHAIFRRGLARTLSALEAMNVRAYVLEDVPDIGLDVPYALAATARLGKQADLRITRFAYDVQQSRVETVFQAVRAGHDFGVLRPQDQLCSKEYCEVAEGERPFYTDNEHLSPAGSMVVKPAFEPLWGG